MARNPVDDPNAAIMNTALLEILSNPSDGLARNGGFLVSRRVAAFREVLVDPDVVRVAALVEREEGRRA